MGKIPSLFKRDKCLFLCLWMQFFAAAPWDMKQPMQDKQQAVDSSLERQEELASRRCC